MMKKRLFVKKFFIAFFNRLKSCLSQDSIIDVETQQFSLFCSRRQALGIQPNFESTCRQYFFLLIEAFSVRTT